MKDTHRIAHHCLPSPSSRLCSSGKPFALCFLLLFCSWPTTGFLGFYPNLLEIIGSHNRSFSAMFHIVCLWFHLNFDSNETKRLAVSENPAQQVSKVRIARQMLHWQLKESMWGFQLCLLRCLSKVLESGLLPDESTLVRCCYWLEGAHCRPFCKTYVTHGFVFLNHSTNLKERRWLHSFKLSKQLFCPHHCVRVWENEVKWHWSFSCFSVFLFFFFF